MANAKRLRAAAVPLVAALIATLLPGLIPAIASAQNAADAPAPLAVTSITPAGDNVPPGRQIVIQFDRAVVPIGRMARTADEVPVEIEPPLACQWRWLDPSALACQLGDGDEPVLATRYTVAVGPGALAADGSRLADTHRSSFVTARPRAEYATFATWQGPDTPVIRVVFNQPVAASSVREHVHLAAGGTRFELAVEPDPNVRRLPRFVRLPGEPAMLDVGARQSVGSESAPGSDEARPVWLVRPLEPLGLGRQAELEIEPGLVSAFGAETGDERRTIVAFDTFPEYRLLGVICRSNDNREVTVPNGAANATPCNPLERVGLQFSSPTLPSEVRDHVAVTPDLAGGRSDYDPWANIYDYSRLGQPHRRGAAYVIWLPERLQADASYRLATVEEGPLDEFGRPLAAPIAVSLRTDHRPPDYTIAHPTAVIESDIDSDVPLYVTNVEHATVDFRRVTTAGSRDGLVRALDIADVDDVQFAVPFGIREMLDGETGALYGRIRTDPPIAKAPYRQTLFAQVTPYQVHVKLGHFNTLVWVSDLDTGEPVAGAAVSIYVDRLVDLSDDFVPRAEARTDTEGIGVLAGMRDLDPDLGLTGYGCRFAELDACPRLFVRVEHEGRLALLPLEPRFEVNAFRASNYTVYARPRPRFGHLHAWGTTAQGVYRAGDTIEFKLYVRDQSNETYAAAPTGPYLLEIVDPTGRSVHVVEDVELSAFGAFDGTYAVPANAAVGWYEFRLTAGFAELSRTPMRVLVTDFTPSSFRVSTAVNGDTFVAGAEVTAETTASLFSGGPYADAEVRVTARIEGRRFRSEHPVAASFRFDNANAPRMVDVAQTTARVDAAGTFRHGFELPETLGRQLVFGTLRVEGAVADDRGRYVADTASARFLAVDRLVGLRNTEWVYAEDEPAAIELVVVDPAGAPVAGTEVTVAIERLETRAARVRGAGSAYLTELIHEWVDVAECVRASGAGPVSCEFVPDAPGRYRATARIEDTQGRPHTAEIPAWVRGRGQVVWSTRNDDYLEIVPEQTAYRIGDTARYLIQNPYPGARALVTVERYGVLAQWVETFESSTPVVEFEVEPDFMPGFYLSVLVMSPRVAAPLPEPGEIDLGKPAFKMGYVEVPVDDPYRRLDVAVRVDDRTYRPRDSVRVRIAARPANREASEPIEAAVVVLDEAVLDLIQGGTRYFDPYRGFNRLDGLDVRNFGLLTRLVGRQGIELKGASPGGDGGAALSMRSLFRYVAYWNPSLALDRRGRGSFELELPDNLTGWRVLVLATTPTDRMGLGEAQFTVNLPTEIRPAMPNQVIEGDRFDAGFTISNRTDGPRDVRVRVAADGDVRAAEALETTVHLDPYERISVSLPVEAAPVAPERDVAAGRIGFSITARDEIDGDGLEYTLPVAKRRTLETAASYGSFTDAIATETLAFPGEIHPDVGEVGVELAATVIGNVDGAFRYMRDYPYVCWEQKLSKAVMAARYVDLAAYVGNDVEWPGSADLPARMLAEAASHQAPNGGMAYFIADDRYASPFLSAYTALAFNWLRSSGHAIPVAVEARLHEYLERLLRRDVLPDFYSRGMASTVRAVALAALAEHGRVTAADLDRYRPHLDTMSLFGKAHYLLAATSVEGGGPRVEEARTSLMQTAIRSAGKLSFNEVLDDGYRRILATPLRTNCAVLSALVADAFSANESDAAGIDDPPDAAIDPDGLFELVRTITQARGSRTHWENTQENMFCMNSLVDYARRFESEQPALAVAAEIDAEPLGQAAFRSVTDEAVNLMRPIRPTDPGSVRTLRISRDGTGRLYYAARMRYASTVEAAELVNAGIDVRRELSVERDGEWVLLGERASVRRGELMRVDIFVSLPTARHFVVVDDPVPGGLEPVNRDLANASLVDADAGNYVAAGGSWWLQFGDWHYYNASRWSFHHRELRHDSARFYSDYLPAGNYHLSYTAQAIGTGDFAHPPVRAEEMYDPDVYGLGLPGTLTVTP